MFFFHFFFFYLTDIARGPSDCGCSLQQSVALHASEQSIKIEQFQFRFLQESRLFRVSEVYGKDGRMPCIRRYKVHPAVRRPLVSGKKKKKKTGAGR